VTERQPHRNHLVQMRLASSALVTVVLSSTLFLVLPATASGLNIAGTSCKKLGLKTTSQNKNYQCVKKGKKLVWSFGTSVIRTKPAVSITPTPRPTLSPSPSPSPEVTPYALPDPNTLTIPEGATKYMAENTIVIPRLGCSGSLVRNEIGVAIGMVTAEHCRLYDSYNKRVLESDGRYSITFASPVNTYYGDTPDNLKNAGVVDKFYLPAVSNNITDFVYGAFVDHSISEVMSAYEASRLQYKDILQLKAGDIIYSSEWPADQPNNTSGHLNRQEFSMTVVGVEDRIASGSIGGGISLVWAAVSPSKDGSDCSYGGSGSRGFIAKFDSQKSIGSLSTFNPFTDKKYSHPVIKSNPAEFERKFNVTGLSKYSAVCGFAYETPTPQTGGVEVYVKVVTP
jgi:hypothetical protein